MVHWDASDPFKLADDWRRRKRGIYSKAFKRRVVAETFEPGASVATVARDHDLSIVGPIDPDFVVRLAKGLSP